MRIVSFPASIAVLLLTAILFLRNFTVLHSFPYSSHDSRAASDSKESNQEGSMEDTSTENTNHRWLNWRQSEALLLKEGNQSGIMIPVDCCPSVMEMIVPKRGRNPEDTVVELYTGQQQKFYEISCGKGVENKPCRFMEKNFHNRSRCVQKHSYSYALVEDSSNDRSRNGINMNGMFDTDKKYVLDYIKVRSGCSCEIEPDINYEKRKRKKVKPSKNKIR